VHVNIENAELSCEADTLQSRNICKVVKRICSFQWQCIMKSLGCVPISNSEVARMHCGFPFMLQQIAKMHNGFQGKVARCPTISKELKAKSP